MACPLPQAERGAKGHPRISYFFLTAFRSKRRADFKSKRRADNSESFTSKTVHKVNRFLGFSPQCRLATTDFVGRRWPNAIYFGGSRSEPNARRAFCEKTVPLARPWLAPSAHKLPQLVSK